MVAVQERATVSLDDVDDYMRVLMKEQELSYREAAVGTVDWLMQTGRFEELAPTLAVTALMGRARSKVHETHRGLTNWPAKKRERADKQEVAYTASPPTTKPIPPGGPLAMVVAADLDRPMVGRWLDVEFIVSKKRLCLAEMTRYDCFEKATYYGGIAASNLVHQRFLRAVGERLEPGQTVQDVFSDGDLATVWHMARKAKT